MKRTAKARARWHIPPAALARCLDPRNLSATTVKATPDPTVRLHPLIGSRYEGQGGVAPKRANASAKVSPRHGIRKVQGAVNFPSGITMARYGGAHVAHHATHQEYRSDRR